ncbi:hypothetical protein ABT234_15640 [Streptomyces sp. NPDC001586]|uniref:hypothetical protein n=1 Tax=unclassified Streptomyces TaxID=2593676 RepID=UPI00332BB640
MTTAVVAGGLLATAVAGATPALASSEPAPQRVSTAIRHAVDGNATAADLQIIKSDPQLARTVPVSRRAGTPVVTEAVPPTTRAAFGAPRYFDQKCLTVDYPLTNTSYLGTTIYTWHHKFSWCTANTVAGAEWTRVISVSPYNRHDYFTDKSSVVYPQGLVTDVLWAPVGGSIPYISSGLGSPYHSHMARSVNLCIVNYSCYASNLPQSDLTIGKDNVYPALARPL